MRLLVWNIQNGGGTRLPHIVEEIGAYDPDVVAVTEYRAGPGVALRAALKERGLPYCETTNPSGNRDGIAVFSRAPIRLKPCQAPPESQFRWLDIDLPEYGFGIGVLHIMAAGSSAKSPCTVAKTRFWDTVLQAAEAWLPEPYLLVGDWNTGARRLDEVGKTFICSAHFAKLSAMGWIDLVARAVQERDTERVVSLLCAAVPEFTPSELVMPGGARPVVQSRDRP